MDKSLNIFLINDKVRAVEAIYEKYDAARHSTKPRPELFKTFDKAIKVDDLVVVETDNTNGRFGMTVVKVTAVDVEPDFEASGVKARWIVQKVEDAAYREVVEKEEAAHEVIKSAKRTAKREELAEQLMLHNGKIKSLPIYDKG